jgi:hypothetical protein
MPWTFSRTEPQPQPDTSHVRIAMPDTTQFPVVFQRLKGLLEPYAPALVVVTDTPETYYLNTHALDRHRREVFFAATQIKKTYVSYYLMPVYMFPDLLADLSPRLRKRMQGKSCFNFTTVEDDLLAELAQLTQRGAERFRQESLL